MRRSSPLGAACGLLLALVALCCPAPARADGSYPGSRQILLPVDRPEQLILATNFGLILSEDRGKTWSFSCEHGPSAYAGPYLLGAPGSHRIFAVTAGAGLIYSDDDSCGWQAAGGALSDVLPYALAVDPSSSERVYAIGVPRQNLRDGDSIYVSDDGGRSFGEAVFTSPPRSALLNLMVAPSRPSTLFATMFTTPENHPRLLRSDDAGQVWTEVADLTEMLGENPFELLAIDPLDEDKLYARILGVSAETLATSNDGGLTFVPSISIPGTLSALLKLASGTLLVGGTTGTGAIGYRSLDGGQTFEAWPAAPHVHALAERDGKLYIAGDSYADGYALAESDDEGTTLRPLVTFKQVQGVTGCVSDVCTESCAYYAGIGLWPEAVCGAAPLPTGGSGSTGPEASAGASSTQGGAPGDTAPDDALGAGVPSTDDRTEPAKLRLSGGGCGCAFSRTPPLASSVALGALALVARTRRHRRRSQPSARRAMPP